MPVETKHVEPRVRNLDPLHHSRPQLLHPERLVATLFSGDICFQIPDCEKAFLTDHPIELSNLSPYLFVSQELTTSRQFCIHP